MVKCLVKENRKPFPIVSFPQTDYKHHSEFNKVQLITCEVPDLSLAPGAAGFSPGMFLEFSKTFPDEVEPLSGHTNQV